MRLFRTHSILTIILTVIGISECGSSFAKNKTINKIVLRNCKGDHPQSVLDSFTRKTHIEANDRAAEGYAASFTIQSLFQKEQHK